MAGRLDFKHVADDWLTAGCLDWFREMVRRSHIVVIRDAFYLFSEREQSVLLDTISEELPPEGLIVVADWAVHNSSYNFAEEHFVKRQFGGRPIQFADRADPIRTSSLAEWLRKSTSLVLSCDKGGEQVFHDAVFRSYESACAEYAEGAPKAYSRIRDAAAPRGGVSDLPYLVFLIHKSQPPWSSPAGREVFGFRVSPGGQAAMYLPREFAFECGRWHLVIGRSGVGKTTMLRALSGSSGDATPFGSCYGGRPVIYYLPQDVTLIPSLTVEQNVLIFSRDPEYMSSIWRQLGLTRDFTARLADERLSGGERQRVAIAQALAAEPDILLLDEPSRGLDRIRRRQFFHYLKAWRESRSQASRPQTTVICVDHNFGDIQEFFDEVVELHRGRLVKVGGVSQ